MKIAKYIRFIKNKILLSLKEQKYCGRLRYIYENNNSPKLVIVFSGFAYKIPKYNYMRTLKDAAVDKLFILDDFGHRGSYYWFENGTDLPLQLVSNLISTILANKKYKNIFTAGSSKGGTCALYYGLKFNASEIFVGAAQYYIGRYLAIPKHKQVLSAMMGKEYSENDIQLLDNMVKQMIENCAGQKSIVHTLYSRKEIELSYQEHMQYMITDLKNAGFHVIEQEDNYLTHDENGIYFSEYLKKYFNNLQ